MNKPVINLKEIKDVNSLLQKAKWLEGKTLAQIGDEIRKQDPTSRVLTKGEVGYVIEKGFFGIEKNSDAKPDIEHLGVEIKTCPLKFDSTKTKLSVKEPLSLNMIDYCEEYKNKDIKESSLYKKNQKILFVLYIHDKSKLAKNRYEFTEQFVKRVIDELSQDYKLIVKKIKEGKAHEIHQYEHGYLTLCPKHNGNFKDPNDKISKRQQPFSNILAEKRAFRLKNSYMNLIISRFLKKPLLKGGWII